MTKLYETDRYEKMGNELLRQYEYVKQTFGDPSDITKLAKLAPDALSQALYELTAIYETLSSFYAIQRSKVQDLDTAYDTELATAYLKYKAMPDETNETARMKAKVELKDLKAEVNEAKKNAYRIEGWKKAIGRYHDMARTQLSYEKSLMGMTR